MNEELVRFDYADKKKERLDKFLVRCLPELSRSRLQGLIKEGLVKVNGEVVSKTGFELESGQQVEVAIPPVQPTDILAQDIPLDIIFENKDVVVIDKPAGMVVHPSAGHAQDTLVNAVLAHAPDLEGIGGEQRPGIVHRLDKNTSGLILVAKNDHSLHILQEQFRTRKVKKIYTALCDGHPPTPTGRIDAAVGRDSSVRKKMAIVSDAKGRTAVSEYHTLETFEEHTLMEVHPETGRTHQIRLHMAFIGCPVTGDTIYGRKRSTVPLSRHFLHASRLTIFLPGEDAVRIFESPLPPDLTRVLAQLRARS
jgi:23S rRNA pseudouridine1911/1915/1917 synthase